MDKFSEETRTKLRSTQIITSLSSLVSELFQNSLDAGASNIEIGVDCEAWSCWVKDDGVGMTKDDLRVLAVGFEQGRYGMFCFRVNKRVDADIVGLTRYFESSRFGLVESCNDPWVSRGRCAPTNAPVTA